MPIFPKIDRERHRKDIFLCSPVSQPDATGFSGTESEGTANDSESFEGSLQGRTIPAKAVKPIVDSAYSLNPPSLPLSNSTEPRS